MIKEGNADSRWSEKKREEEDSVRTVDCLRGRLLAERVASRKAKEEADQLESKLIELETLLKEEAESRNRAERKLKLLLKKLESMNISYVSDESERPGSVDKSDISSLSSAASSSTTKELERKNTSTQMKMSAVCEDQGSEEKAKLSKGSENLQHNISPIAILNHSCNSSTTEVSQSSAFQLVGQACEMRSNENTTFPIITENLEQDIGNHFTLVEDCVTYEVELGSEKPSPVESDHSYNGRKSDEQSVESLTEHDQDPKDTDDSMALAPVDMPQRNHETIDPDVLDASVKEVLDVLRHAKEQLQSSMERRRNNFIRVS